MLAKPGEFHEVPREQVSYLGLVEQERVVVAGQVGHDQRRDPREAGFCI